MRVDLDALQIPLLGLSYLSFPKECIAKSVVWFMMCWIELYRLVAPDDGLVILLYLAVGESQGAGDCIIERAFIVPF